MMKQSRRRLIWMALCGLLVMPIAHADDVSSESMGGEAQGLLEDIKTYLYGLGLNLGYELDTAKATPPTPAKNTLITTPNDTTSELQAIAKSVMNGLFGAIPVNTLLFEFLPTDSKIEAITAYIEALNPLANQTYPSYDTVDHSPLSVSALMDQKTYQLDPVNQALLNILTTPDKTYCMANDGVEWLKDCDLLYQTKVMSNVVGTLPPTDEYFTYDYQASFLNDLNSNTLLAPLLYTTTASTSKQEEGTGLLGTNQATAAANFIRYVSGAVKPVPSIQWADYNNQLAAAYQKPAGSTETSEERTAREQALAKLTDYVTSARIYAAKNSVALSNLHSILTRRLPQENLSNSSQAFYEFQMATRRLYDPTKDTTQWLDSINTASSATVQKEMAILLSEINYQLYLNRQQDERLLLTNTLILLNSLASDRPPTTLTTNEE